VDDEEVDARPPVEAGDPHRLPIGRLIKDIRKVSGERFRIAVAEHRHQAAAARILEPLQLHRLERLEQPVGQRGLPVDLQLGQTIQDHAMVVGGVVEDPCLRAMEPDQADAVLLAVEMARHRFEDLAEDLDVEPDGAAGVDHQDQGEALPVGLGPAHEVGAAQVLPRRSRPPPLPLQRPEQCQARGECVLPDAVRDGPGVAPQA